VKVTAEFVKIYSKTFEFIHDRLGPEGVKSYWREIAPIALADLKKMVEVEGLWGAKEYWQNTLMAEDAGFRWKYNDNSYELEIYDCPSMRILDKPYGGYCKHCDAMYRPIFEELGYKYEIDTEGKGKCRITISK
jgi:hypothetical protein